MSNTFSELSKEPEEVDTTVLFVIDDMFNQNLLERGFSAAAASNLPPVYYPDLTWEEQDYEEQVEIYLTNLQRLDVYCKSVVTRFTANNLVSPGLTLTSQVEQMSSVLQLMLDA